MPAAGTKRALAPVISKQAQTGGKKADSLSCTICHVAAKPYWYGQSLGHSQGLFLKKKIYFILFFLACACVLGGNVKQNHCLALTRLDLLSGPKEGSCFDRYLCNISDSTHDRSVEATDS